MDGTRWQQKSKHAVVVENLQMVGSKNDANPEGSNYSNYSKPAQPSAQQAPETRKQQPTEIPVIDIDEDEIPF